MRNPVLVVKAFAAALAVTGVVLWTLPETVIANRLILIDPDRTVRSLDPFWVRTAGWFAAGTAVLLVSSVAILRRFAPLAWLWIETRWVSQTAPPEGLRWTTADIPRPTRLALLAAIAVGATIRFIQAWHEPINFDEAVTYVNFASRTLIDIASDYHIPNNHVLHTLLAGLSFRLGGSNTIALRLPALLASILCIPLTFVLARRLFDSETAAFAAALAAIAPPLTDLGSTARGYSLLTVGSLLMFITATHIVAGAGRRAWVALATTAALTIYTMPVGVYCVVAVGVWILTASSPEMRPRMVRGLVLTAVAVALGTAILYAPVVIRSGLASLIDNVNTRPQTLNLLLPGWIATVRALALWSTLPAPLVFGPVVALGLAAAVTARPVIRRRTLQLVAALSAIVIAMLIQRIVPPPRALVPVMPLLWIVTASGWRRILGARPAPYADVMSRWFLAPVALLLTWGGSYLATAGSRVDQTMREVASVTRTLGAQIEPDDALVAHHFSGLVYPGRYQLMLDGRSPRLFHSYMPRRERRQLDPYRRLYLLARDCGEGLAEIGFASAGMDADFEPPQILYQSPALCAIEIRRRRDVPLRPSPYAFDPWGFGGLW